ncbi:MAG: AAA family ATPase, partial [Planctomycetes bacterium]|nr:AAA family ATPase [Planctomycetota bacterium]
IIVIAATNRPDILDPALLRPGRFDREIVIDLPDIKGREEVLRVHTRRVTLGPDVDLSVLARGTPSFSGAELEALVNEATIHCAMRDGEQVTMGDLEESRDKVRWGRQKTAKAMVDADRRITAYHEGGHALVAHFTKAVEPLHKVTIIPRGFALGATMQLPERDRYHMQRAQVMGQLRVLFGGRIAEELACEDVSTGASNDIQQATRLARRMVTEWGMSEKVGLINYSQEEETVFLGREITRTRDHAEATSLEIDREVRRIVDEAYGGARGILEAHREELDRVAEALLRYETLNGAEVVAVIQGGTVAEVRAQEERRIAEKLRLAQEAERRAAREAKVLPVKGAAGVARAGEGGDGLPVPSPSAPT